MCVSGGTVLQCCLTAKRFLPLSEDKRLAGWMLLLGRRCEFEQSPLSREPPVLAIQLINTLELLLILQKKKKNLCFTDVNPSS